MQRPAGERNAGSVAHGEGERMSGDDDAAPWRNDRRAGGREVEINAFKPEAAEVQVLGGGGVLEFEELEIIALETGGGLGGSGVRRVVHDFGDHEMIGEQRFGAPGAEREKPRTDVGSAGGGRHGGADIIERVGGQPVQVDRPGCGGAGEREPHRPRGGIGVVVRRTGQHGDGAVGRRGRTDRHGYRGAGGGDTGSQQ